MPVVSHGQVPARMLATESDARLNAVVVQELRASGYVPLTRIGCRTFAGIIELHGSVPTYHLKQVAQAVVLRLDEVAGVRNQLQVE